MYPALRGVGDARVAAHLDEFDDLRRAVDGQYHRGGVRSADRGSDGHFGIQPADSAAARRVDDRKR
jgi:hypothetical protein